MTTFPLGSRVHPDINVHGAEIPVIGEPSLTPGAGRTLLPIGSVRVGDGELTGYVRAAQPILSDEERDALVAALLALRPSTLDSAPQPVAWLVAERRGGRWLLGDDWVRRCDTLAEAQREAADWRAITDPGEVAVLAVTVVDGA